MGQTVVVEFDAINEQFALFQENHEKFMNGNSAAGLRARKAIGEIKKLATGYRQASTEEDASRKSK